MSNRDRVALLHMLDHAREAVELIHGYDTVDFDILWRIVHDDLPPLISQLERLVSSGEK